MSDSQKVSKITIIVVCVIVILIMVIVCFSVGIFSFEKESESITFDYSTELDEKTEIREFVEKIEGEEYVTLLDNGKKVNISTAILEKYILNDFAFENFEISCIDNVTKITCSITNNASERKTLKGFYILLNDENGICKTCKLVEGETISAGATIDIDIIINEDVSNLYSLSLKEAYIKE